MLPRIIPFRTFFTISNNRIPNLCARRDHLYGNEEGHDIKNEVRKEKWIKKKSKATKGLDWRLSQGYDSEGLAGISASMSNWSEVDSGHPGAPTDWQKRLRQRNNKLSQEIFDAYMIVQRAKNIKN